MDKKRGKRLYNLRKTKNLTQGELYDEIQKIIAKNEGTNIYGTENGKQAICKLEGGDGLSIKNAIAYSEYFNVSLDYLYFDKKHYKPEYEEIQNMLGLSDDALNTLEQLNKKDKKVSNILNKLLSPSLSPLFMELLDALYEHSYIKTKSLVSQYPGHTFLNSYNIKGHYKKPIMLKPEDLEYLSLFKISEISKKLADEIKNGGDRV